LLDAAPLDATMPALDAAVLDMQVLPDAAPPPDPPTLLGRGARLDADGLGVRIFSAAATRVEIWLYAEPMGAPVASVALSPEGDGHWRGGWATLPDGLGEAIYYGYRIWGPNWPWDPDWTPGSTVGFQTDVDAAGNRFNPNKLLLDPYALEMSHDPFTPPLDGRSYASGAFRERDSGNQAPKGIVWRAAPVERPAAPTRPLRDEIIYEVHVRGLSMHADSVPDALRGTYAGAARLAADLKAQGVTAVEFLPLHETQNDQNDVDEGTPGDNYWGYSTLSYFAPDRRYSADKGPGGPTRELKAMIDAFHAEGLKVYLDVVYNHTGEGGTWGDPDTAALLSLRGIDNATYYQTVDGRHYYSNNGVGPNVRMTQAATADLIIDSLRYAHEDLGFDGFRFDLASILGNRCDGACFEYTRDALLTQITEDLPIRADDGGPGIDLIAEAWAIGAYQVGEFPRGWAEWNDQYRDTIRTAQNRLDVAPMTPGRVAARVHGSSDLFRDDGRQPWHSINFVVAHDGLTLADLYRCNDRNNGQDWPYGPSDGGTDNNLAWDHRGAPERQRQAARTGLAVLMLSAGVPMITGGTERLQSLRCNNNAYNLDSPANWIPWDGDVHAERFARFSAAVMQLRQRHPALRPAAFTEGVDRNADGVADLTWLRPDGQPADGGYMQNEGARYLAWRIDGTEAGDPAASIYVGWNWGNPNVRAVLPPPRHGHRWFRVLDTAAWMEDLDNVHAVGAEDPVPPGGMYDLHGRSLVVLLELPR
jgi:glycogen operon protein